MRDYEVVYIFKSTLTTEEIEGRLEAYHAKILGADGSEITAVEHWGKRQLAYPIDRNDNGYYVVTQFTAPPTVLPDYERVLTLDDDLLRHLVVLSEGELPVPVPVEVDDDRRRPGDDETRGGPRGRDRVAVAPDEGAADDAPDESAADDDSNDDDADDDGEGKD